MRSLRSRLPASLYVAGPFAQGYTQFYDFLIPLYALSLGMSASKVGMLVGARSLLAVFLSIHVGTLMDRFGTRRVTLFFIWTAMGLAPVFPLLPWFWPLLLLQVVNGAALQFAWSGSQTLIAQLAEGEPSISAGSASLRALGRPWRRWLPVRRGILAAPGLPMRSALSGVWH
jgi:predicted MFS family arabinose efflux permease